MHVKQPIPFRGFDERATTRIYFHGRLPHWRQDGCTYFVTFRLGDALPLGAAEQIEYEKKIWLKNHGIDDTRSGWQALLLQLDPKERATYQRLHAMLIDRSLDLGHGTCQLRNSRCADIVRSALEHFHNIRVITGDFVVMPNHVHALLTPLASYKLEDILTSIKGYTARQINQLLGRKGKLWQKESYDHIVRDCEQLSAYQEYIALNPKKAKLRDGEYIHLTAKYFEQNLP